MKKLFIGVVLLSLLVACGEQLPPTPPPPGQVSGVGGAIYGMAAALPSWASAPKNVALTPQQAYFNDAVIVTVSGFDYIYSNGYYFNSKSRTWEKFALQGDQTKDWLKKQGIGTVTVDASKFAEGDNYLVIYACSKVGSAWDCNNQHWMLSTFKVAGQATGKIPQMANVNQFLINEAITPFTVTGADAMKDNFAAINVITYTAHYREPKGLSVMVHVSDFNNRQELDQTMNDIFKDKMQNGFQKYGGNNLALFLTPDDHRVAFWTSGKQLIYVETFAASAANKEVIEGYLKKYPSDMKKV